MKRFLATLCLSSLFSLSACNRDSVTTYRVPKEASAPAAFMPPSAEIPRGLKWTLPRGWKEQASSGMRVGSFQAKGPVDISIIPLSGEAGGDLPNINRWRGQIDLAPISEGEIAKNSETIRPGGRAMLFVDFSEKNKRVMAAIYHRGETSWFFKMTGDRESVGATKSSFVQFLSSIKFPAHE